MSNIKNILFVGVGGQGTILASKIFTEGLIKSGYDVKMSEVHGMAQRGGSVVTQVRYGEKVYSPLIEKGTVDVIVSFEKIEAARWIEFLKENGTVIINDYEIRPITVLVGNEVYPEDVLEKISQNPIKIKVIHAYEKAKDIGNSKVQNSILLGALVKACGLEKIDWEEIIKSNVNAKFLDMNIKAFNIGNEIE
ncbi:indolepyruvate oxidoreductase subunit beta [Clostridium polynesiense]|uniref:indolepyruvate oxidoreductase subunit beta n=1 Tax=Clostridium polynesiense TaxID=1325933 RepID=UPI00058AF3F5|nr:indolepyruvate oxidoreductase subunit beta [Clostridium polynesiense]